MCLLWRTNVQKGNIKLVEIHYKKHTLRRIILHIIRLDEMQVIIVYMVELYYYRKIL